MRWGGQQFVDGSGLAQIGLGNESQLFEPLKDTVNGWFRNWNMLCVKILLDVLSRLVPT